MITRHAKSLTRVPSAMGLTARLAHERARAGGIATRPLLEKAGLTSQQMSDLETRLPVGNQVRYLNLVATALGDDSLGLNLALDFDLRRGGLFYYVLASSATLAEVFERGARFTSLVNEGVVQEVLQGRRFGITMHYSGVKRLDDRHQIEFWLVALMRICRQITARNLKPVGVKLTHYRAGGHAQFANFMGCDVEFGASRDEIFFARETAQVSTLNADPYLNRLLIDICKGVMSQQRRATGSFAARVENAIAPRLPHGKARAADIAAKFGMSERTFARRLAEEGQTFTQLLDGLRLQLARRYLLEDHLPISKTAWLLGYHETGAFSHAFRRWTGKSPSEVVSRSR